MRILVVEDEKKTAAFMSNVSAAAKKFRYVLGRARHSVRAARCQVVSRRARSDAPYPVAKFICRRTMLAEIVSSNNGPGLSPILLPRVFDRFFRGDESHNHEVEGCGLGLSIAQWITDAPGGSIQIASEPEKLTTVRVRLDLPTA